MTITSTRYPIAVDGDDNLFVVHDSLRARLFEDYNPGDTSITVEGDALILSRWPTTGLITLTDQCSAIQQRAISFSYTGFDPTTGIFSGLSLLPNFIDNKKSKKITNVTQNVMDRHHNNIKDALIAIETFIGVKGTIDTFPFGPTLEGRINFLRKLVLTPRVWFESDKKTGIVPLEVEFRDLSFRLGTDGNTGPIVLLWDFGDNTSSTVSVISETSVVPGGSSNVLVYDQDGGTIKKTYMRPGNYDVKLTVSNDFGQDECIFQKYINARIQAPNEAVVKYIAGEGQISTPGSPSNGPYTVVPKIRAPINTLISMLLESGENAATPGFTWAGEPLNGSSPIDPIINYTWHLGDDIPHENAPETKASFSVGGIYDMKLRVDTEFGAYRITSYKDSIDIVENTNLWMWIFQDDTTVRAYEYGLISESFKVGTVPTLTVNRNASFLDSVPESGNQKKEFRKNTGFAPRGTVPSGKGGSTMLYWASGRNASDAASSEQINFVEFNGFNGTYINRTPINRPWNWATLNSPSNVYFVFGDDGTAPSPNTSFTNVTKTTLDLVSFTKTDVNLTASNFENGAQELLSNISLYDSSGNSLYGDYSVYRTTWKDSTGYIARNDGVGPFFRIKSFYRTEGSVGAPVQSFRKLLDIQGSTKFEGSLTTLSQGIYMFNNSGSISAFSDVSNTWSTGGPGVNSVAYRALQDTSVQGFDSNTNTLLVASDGDHRAYMSFDYSPNVFLKFDETSLSFFSLGSRPQGEQWIMGVG
jgi:PKD repeat protein